MRRDPCASQASQGPVPQPVPGPSTAPSIAACPRPRAPPGARLQYSDESAQGPADAHESSRSTAWRRDYSVIDATASRGASALAITNPSKSRGGSRVSGDNGSSDRETNMPTRRDALTLLAGSAAATLTTRLLAQAQATQPATAGATAPAATGPFTLAPLPYPADALEPHIDAQTMTIHHDRHHQAYVNNLNAAVKDRPELQKRPPGPTGRWTRRAYRRKSEVPSGTTAADTSITISSGTR